MNNIYKVLDDLKIKYNKHDHPAVFTVEEAELYDQGIIAGKSKNLFLRNEKADKYYLVVIESTRKIDFTKLSSVLNEKKLSFASPGQLLKLLGLTPGSVSPFGLINDSSKLVHVLVDKGLLKHPKLSFHPNINTSTLVISTKDFDKYLTWTGNNFDYIDI